MTLRDMVIYAQNIDRNNRKSTALSNHLPSYLDQRGVKFHAADVEFEQRGLDFSVVVTILQSIVVLLHQWAEFARPLYQWKQYSWLNLSELCMSFQNW